MLFGHEFSPTIHTFGPLVALGSFLAILYLRREGLRRGFDPEILTGLAVEVLLVGVVGSRILFIAVTPEAFTHNPNASAFYNWFVQYVALWNGGLVWYGGLVPAAAFALWRARKLGLPFRTMGDVFAPAVMLGLAIGRVGCLMAGDDHGKLSPDGLPHWWTLTFTDPKALVAPNLLNKPLWPSQPLMGIGAFTIFLVTHAVQKRFQTRPLAVMYLMMTLYPIHRFLVEFTRGDSVRKFLLVYERDVMGNPVDGLSTSQTISIPLAALMFVLLVRKLRAPEEQVELPSPQSAARGDAPDAAPPPAPAAPASPAASAAAEPKAP